MKPEKICCICEKPIYLDKDAHHDLHEDDCKGEGCECDLVAHAGCCPDCNSERPEPDSDAIMVMNWAQFAEWGRVD